MEDPNIVKNKWDDLHEQKRFCPVYPNDRVVAWTFRNFTKESASQYRLLDLGCGAGRHAIFFASEGYNVVACDFSQTGINETLCRARERGVQVKTHQCEANQLPFGDCEFDGVLCYGVLYYLPWEKYRIAVQEINRVLKAGGKAFVVTRADGDSRIINATRLDTCTYRLPAFTDSAPSDVEAGMIMTFLGRVEAAEMFSIFQEKSLDRCIVTSNNGNFTDDDWLIQVRK